MPFTKVNIPNISIIVVTQSHGWYLVMYPHVLTHFKTSNLYDFS
jgi:hypothetical protein